MLICTYLFAQEKDKLFLNPLEDAKSHKRVTDRLTEIRNAAQAEALRIAQEQEMTDITQEVDDAAEAEMQNV